MTFQICRKRLPYRALHVLDRVGGTGNSRANEREFKLRLFDQRAGQARHHAARLPAGQRRRDSGKRHQILCTVRRTRISQLAPTDIHYAVLALLRSDPRSRISISNSSGGTKNGFC
jgi:hypothetical protein